MIFALCVDFFLGCVETSVQPCLRIGVTFWSDEVSPGTLSHVQIQLPTLSLDALSSHVDDT